MQQTGLCIRVWSKMTALNDLKWHTTFVFLIGAILGFADPITDALTLAEFHKENHMQWFNVGLGIMILPCFLYFMVNNQTLNIFTLRGVTTDILLRAFSFNPFSPALASLKAFVLCLKNFKKLWRGEEVDWENHDVDELNRFLLYVKLLSFAEAATESIPQFIFQLYAASVQEEPVKVIQIISLSVSCLSVVWAFTGADELLHDGEIEVKTKHKVLFFVANLLFLTSRLFAVCYFILAFRRWATVVLVPHSLILALVDCIFPCPACDERCILWLVFFLYLRWIRDDLCVPVDEEDIGSRRRRLKRMQCLCHVMFVMENFLMILLFYNVSKYSSEWYAFPVTVYVCTASILGSSIRLVHFRFLLKDRVAPEEVVGPAIQQGRLPNVFVTLRPEWE